ncbi:MAG: dehydrogenase E1 component subunit alpha/beta [Flavobacteriales bacterium]
MNFDRKSLSDDELKALYSALVLPRLIEEKMLIYLRQGKISKWFSSYGQEAVSVGSALALDMDEFIMTMHRNLGVFTSRKVPLARLFAQFQGKQEGFTKGRDRSFHFGSREHHIVGMISHLGPQLAIADGIALAEQLEGTGKIALAFTGDGGASEGDFHEALNVAAVWDLPVIFVVENNQWGLSTPSNEQFRCESFIDKGIGYGMEAMQVDGNNILEVYNTVSELKRKMADDPKPVLLECITFRMRGHEEASGTKYYPEGLQDQWKVKDPVSNFEDYMLDQGIVDKAWVDELKDNLLAEVSNSFQEALSMPRIVPNTEVEQSDLFAESKVSINVPSKSTKEMRFVDAVSDGLREAMKKHDNLLLMGQDIAQYGGVFKVTEGFVNEFGIDRVRNTPLCESAIIGSALGLSIKGYKSMVEMQFSDFVTCGFNQIVNNLAKIHWRWEQNADVVVRMPTGAGVAAGPFHSQSTESWFFHTPGLKVLYPAFPADAKGLLLAAFEDPNPVLYFEHKYLYRTLSAQVPEGYYTTEIGKAAIVSPGTEMSIITYGLGVHWALEVCQQLNDRSIEVIDLRTLAPLDYMTVFESVKKTSKALVLHEDSLTGGIGAEVAARIGEELFEYLDAPVVRCASLDTPVPFDALLEENYLAKSRLMDKVKSLLEY